MPAGIQNKILVPCPHCGHQQPESRVAISTVCRKCGQYYRVQETLKPAPKPPEHTTELRRITCFDCAQELAVPVSAQSAMCKRCSAYVDLRDYAIANAVCKNFKTKGAFVIEPRGYVFNTDVIAGDAVIKGRFLGKIRAERSLTIYSTAEIKGTFKTACLIIPEGNHFHWPQPISIGSAAIAGELTADLHAEYGIILKATARMFGDMESKNLVVEAGAVVVGQARIGARSG
jgi:cytoskeletal protein CcmA (bactofilin family)